ncbi:MAG TPA: hypothetical protein DCS93_00420 [Microscillaceae bacterium]|nr:hypothetical protein [Microscillaceae bacterium]
MQAPDTQYAVTDNGINIAYQQFGKGPQNLIVIAGWVSNIEEIWNLHQFPSWILYLASFTKVIIYDRRGLGLSDKTAPNHMEDRIEDIKAIMQSLNINKASFLGYCEGAATALYFAANYPDKVEKMIVSGGFAKLTQTDDYPIGQSQVESARIVEQLLADWGQPNGLDLMAPSIMHYAGMPYAWAKFLRASASPSTAKSDLEMTQKIDVRHCLGQITVPVLILHRKDDRLISAAHSHYLQQHIKGAQLLMPQGVDHLPWVKTNAVELSGILTFLLDQQIVTVPDLSFEDFSKMYRIKAYLEKNQAQNVTINQICKEFGLNEFKLKTGFKKLFKTTIRQYLKSYRLKTAIHLLTNTDMPLDEISQKVGYVYANNFSATFKSKFGCSPRQYRRTHYRQ